MFIVAVKNSLLSQLVTDVAALKKQFCRIRSGCILNSFIKM
jgi:hypothetical protein